MSCLGNQRRLQLATLLWVLTSSRLCKSVTRGGEKISRRWKRITRRVDVYQPPILCHFQIGLWEAFTPSVKKSTTKTSIFLWNRRGTPLLIIIKLKENKVQKEVTKGLFKKRKTKWKRPFKCPGPEAGQETPVWMPCHPPVQTFFVLVMSAIYVYKIPVHHQHAN